MMFALELHRVALALPDGADTSLYPLFAPPEHTTRMHPGLVARRWPVAGETAVAVDRRTARTGWARVAGSDVLGRGFDMSVELQAPLTGSPFLARGGHPAAYRFDIRGRSTRR